jgi:3-phenylpropionate/trans-cinnamate dioxygenase ferredoxin reductase subunit
MRTFVIVGAGLTGLSAASTLRQEGFDGRVLMVGDDPLSPYERPPLTKEFIRGEQELEKAYLKDDEFYREEEIDLITGTSVVALDTAAKTVSTSTGERITYDALLLSTGVRNREPDIHGAHLHGVHQLRTAQEATAIRGAARRARSVVIAGSGFIGCELAASFRTMGLEVTIVEPASAPLQRVLGAGFGGVLGRIHADHGVRFIFGETIAALLGTEHLEAVKTSGGTRIDTDLAILAIGTVPNVELAEAAGVEVGDGILVDERLRTNVPSVYAAGDVASHSHPFFGRIRVEHFDNAEKMGPAAARNMLGAAQPFADPHWFWSDQYESMIQMGGYTLDWEGAIIRGSVEERSFSAFKLSESGHLVASLSLDRPRDVRRSLPLIGSTVDPEVLADPEADLRELVSASG